MFKVPSLSYITLPSASILYVSSNTVPVIVLTSSSLTEIFIPQSVSNIGNAAFYKSIIQNTMYEGNEQEWNKIVIEDNNKCILSNINYNV